VPNLLNKILQVIARFARRLWRGLAWLLRWAFVGGGGPAPPDAWLLYLLVPPFVGVVGLGCFAAASAGFNAFAVTLLIAAGAFVFGGALGFLFGLPRSSKTHSNTTGGWFSSSTSLEEISDWLTKILVGLGLVEIGKLVDRIHRLVTYLAPAIDKGDMANAVALSTLTLFAISGFLFFYLFTRIFLAGKFARAEAELRQRISKIQAASADLEAFLAP